MSGEVKFFILRDDGSYYAGTVDRNPIWTEKKRSAAPFKTREEAQRRMTSLPPRDNGSYEIESGTIPVRKAEEVRADSMNVGDCFEDEYETAYTFKGPTEKDGESMIEALTNFNGEPMLFFPENMVYKISYE